MSSRAGKAERVTSTWVELLRARAAERPEDRAYTFLSEGEEEAGSLTYSELDLRARAVGTRLQQLGLTGERALLLYPPGLDFVAAFLGCLYAGVVAVPAYPPRSARTLPRLAAIARDARPAAALTTSDLLETSRSSGSRIPELAALRWLATDSLDAPGLAGEWREPEIDGDTLAFLQYTSGSTALPKGVMVSHRNLLHNEEMIRAAFRQSESSVIVGWLPLYHDMGLIGNVLQPLYLGAPCVLMSPVAFLQRPLRWLRAISRYRATTSGGPNFAYDLCVKRISPAERQGLDLSCWDLAFNGAEPVRPDTLERFAAAFGPSGFRSEAFYPCYGLAEATLFVAGGAAGEPAAVNGFRGEDLERGRAAPASPATGSRRLVGCGRSWSGQRIAIVDPETGSRRQPDEVGEIWVAGPSVARGYWRREEETGRTFQARIAGEDGEAFLRTGDLGFVSGGELYITGRLKDLIILRGRNLYPQDLELTAERSHPALRPGCGAAFSVDAGGEERLVLVYELERRRESEHEAAAEALRRAVAEEHEAQVHDVVLVRMGSVPKTSSGKIQRHACRAAYLAGDLEVVGCSALSSEAAEEEGEVPAPPTALDRSLLAALGPVERRAALESWLAAEAGRALGLPASRVDPSRPLTALGLDSLGAVEIKSRAEETLGVEISLGALLEGVSLAGLAVDVLERLAEPPGQALAAELVPLGEETGELPLSLGQRGLWYLHRLAPESLAYHLAGAGRVRGPLDTDALVRAFHALVERHPSLRTTFGEAAGGPVQRVHAALTPEVVVLDLAVGEDLEARLAAEVWRPFDLEQGPLVRLGVLRPAAGEPVLFLALHHMVSDFGSLAVMARDLSVLYARETGRPAPPLAPLGLRYTDYVRWQEEWLAGPRGEGLWEYWREALAPGGAEPPYLDLPADRPRPAVQTWDGGARVFRLGSELAADLQSLARRRGATLYMALLAAFEAVLARYTGQTDLVIGSPTTGRSAGAVADLVGYFVNPVALRVLLRGEPGFQDLLDEVRRVVVGAFQHQDFPFPLLAERLQPQRDRSRPPLLDVVFTFQKAHGAGAELGGFALGSAGARMPLGDVEIESLPLAPVAAPYSLDFMVAEVEAGLGALLRFNTALFDGATMERLAGHYQILLRGALADPAASLWDLPLLTAEETRHLLTAAGRDVAEWPDDVLLHEFFEAQARRTPDAVALIGGEERLTYRELDERADRVARRLRALGVGPETRVGVFLQRTPRLLVAMLGILKAGGAYVPLDPAYPRERIEAILEDAQAPVVVTEEMMRAEEENPAGLPALEPLPVRMGRLAYVIYTSGSTGRPKGVAIEHRSASALMRWSREKFSAEELKGVLASTSICFDMSVFELFAPLAWGGTVILADNALALPHIPAKDEVTLIDTVPSAMAELLRLGAVPKSVKTVNLGGEPLRGVLARGVHALGTVERLLNLYGPSEDTTFSTVAEVGAEGEPTIGRLLTNGYGYVVDRNFGLAPVGVPGELYLGGAGVSRGYLGRPDLTAERYVPDPFSAVPGERLYKTGDLIRWRPDGELEYLGRLDHQVKVRGFRVELGEIETALLAHPEIQDAAVLALGEGGDRRLVAYVVGNAPDLRGYLKEKLPEYMVPSAFVALDALPLTPNGKIDRRALAKVEPDRAAEAAGYVAPRTPTEERLAAIWREVLSLEKVGVRDDFFELGGHSLLATQLVSRLRESFGVELPLRRLFEVSTVESLAAELAGTETAVAPPLRPVDRSGDLPLSLAQERLWFLDQLAPGSATYNLPVAVRLSGPLRIAALAAGLERIAVRHEVLRTRFESRAGQPVQVIERGTPLVLARVDLGGLPPERREAEALTLCAREAARPFDLSRGPLLRPVLFRLEPREWICLVVMHHIAADGWSLGVFLRELAMAYTALSQGSEPALPELPVQYADFAVWQRRWLQGETLRAEIAWWREQLAGAPPVLELPLDRPRPAAQSFRGAHERVGIPAGLCRDLERLAQPLGATAYMVLLAAFGALLGRLSGQEDVVVGSPVAGRTRGETEGLIGFFVNTLALRVDLSQDPSFETLLSRVRERVLAALTHQDLPFEKLVEELAPERSLAHSPIIQVLLAVQTNLLEESLPGLRLRRLDVDAGISKFDLSLDLAQEADGGFSGWLEYDRDLFEAATARRLAGQFVRILEAVAGQPGPKVSELPLLSPAERQTLLADWSRTPGEHRTVGTVFGLFAEQALKTPDKPAVVSPGESLTFRELEECARRLAGRLQREPLAGLMADPGPGLAVGLLGIFQSGAALVPLSPAQPDERIALIAADCGIEVLVAERRYLERARRLAPRVICLDEVDDTAPAIPLEPPAESLAYVIYTSGSTGLPKGVGVSHANLVPMLDWSREYFGLDETRRVLQSLSYAFDFGLWEILTTLISGGAFFVPGPEDAGDPEAYGRLVKDWGIDTLHATPSFFQAMAQSVQPGTLAGLRTLHLGGEALSRGQVERFAAAVGGECRLYNGYGPTETTVNSLIFEIGTRGALRGGERVPVGRPSAYNTAYVLDRWGQPAPVGVAGELWVGGAGVARGYLGRPELTAEKFVPDPFGAGPGARVYRTGDLVRWLPSGDVEFLGRIDHQVKVRGFRIELGEVESVLRRHPGVNEAVVTARSDRAGNLALVGYVLGEVPAEELRTFLRQRLPEAMVPPAFVTLGSLPLTSSGKVDRRALPEPQWGALAEGVPQAPRTPVEEMLAGIWSELLGLERVGLEASFFELGGHSLLATRLMSRVRQSFGVELPLRRLFEVPTVAGLAAEIETLLRGGRRAGTPLARGAEGGEHPLSFAQERLWFLDRLEPGSPLYNIPAAVRLAGLFDVAAFASALGEIMRRHQALRTVFSEVASRPIQRIAPWTSFALPVVDLSVLPEELRDAATSRLIREEARTPFDLGAGRLARALLLRLGGEEHVLALTFHHIAADGWSIDVFLREVSALYTAFAAGRPSPLPELAIQYTDFAVWQREWLQGGVLEEQLAYWRAALAGLPPALDLPTDRPRPAARGPRGAYLPLAITGELAAAVRSLAQDQEATPFMVLLAGLQALLARVSGQDDLAVGSVVANRNRLEIEPLIGFFVNTLVLRGELAGDPDFRGLLRRTRASALGAYTHQDVPFEKLVEELTAQRDPSRTPLFQVALALQNASAPPLELPGLEAELLDTDAGGSRFDLTLLLRDAAEGFVGSVEYAVDLFDAGTVERLLGHYRTLLEGIVADPGRPVADLPLMTREEARQLLAEAVRDTADWPRNVLLHEFFEAQARRTPDAVALIGGDERLTYRELDERADRMARRLRALGVGPEVRVGVFLQRTPRLLVAMLGILKAGGAYVPLDPAYPRERIEAILADAEAPVVITEEMMTQADPEELPELEPPPVRMGRLAYVIYTSGSTGKPKGVAIEHRSVSALMHWSRENFSAAELAGVLASTSICFDMSVFELFAPLAWGGTVILADNALALPDLPARDEVTLIDTVPSAMAELLRQGAVPKSVKTVNLGGEPLRGVLARGVHALGTVTRLLNLYGPSEDTTFSTVAEVGAEGEPTIGRILTNGYGYVVDRNFRLMPVGVPGELYVGGVGVSRGYLGRPDLTAERYVPDPFSTLPGARLYMTGDLIRWRPDGELEYLGRLDHQVKVRGFRVELGEIETALLAHPQVQDAAVLALGEGGDRRLVAYVVGEASELRGYLKEKLPEYMVPSSFVVLDALPLTPNGKIDRRALAKIEPERAVEADGYVAPRTAAEARLAEIWSEILDLERVGVQDDFFDLGGHSLLATQLVSRVRETLGVELPLRRLFEVSTIEGLSLELAGLGAAAAPSLRPVDRSGDLPLSFAQERLWFLDRLEPGSPLYNIPAAMRLKGGLDAAALASALGEVVRRHEALRTVFAEAAGRPVQRIASWEPCELPVAEAGREDVERLLREEARTPFDLGAGRLMRARLLRLSGDDHVLAVTFHHVAADGWSIGVFLRELSELYRSFTAGRPSPLPELAIQYADFAVWQREWLQGEVLDEQLAYWRAALAGLPPALDLPTDRPRPAARGTRGAYLPLAVEGELAAAVRSLARDQEATPFMVLLAGLQALLARVSGQDDLAVGSVVANRNRLEIEPLIGFFVNTLVLRGELAGDPDFQGLLRRTRVAALGAYAHQDVPFEKLVEELTAQRDPSRTPLFQVALALQNATPPPLELPGLKAEPLDTDAGGSRFDLTLLLLDSGDGFVGTVEYAVDLFDAGTVERLMGHYRTLLKGIVTDLGRPVTDLPLLTPEETCQLLAEAVRDTADWPRDVLLNEFFEAQAKRTPDAVALIGGAERLTYRELDERADRMARRLRTLGVGPEVRVGVFLQRTPRLLVAMLGILKAGGAYVPLDPAYPRERIEAILADAEAPVVITEEMMAQADPADLPELEPSPVRMGRLAYVIYTSGSTGKPKGVAIEHRSASALMHWSRENFSDAELKGVLASTSICFDMSVFELFAPLAWGGTAILAENALALPHIPARDEVTLIDTVPSAMAELLRQGAVPKSVKTVNLGGEPLRGVLARGVHALGTVERLLNLYGPSEDTTFSTVAEVGAEGEPTIGRLLTNGYGYVVDRNFHLMPVGVPGELYLGGAGVSRGYLGRPDLTAERYVPDPFSSGSRRAPVQNRRPDPLARGRRAGVPGPSGPPGQGARLPRRAGGDRGGAAGPS